MRGVKKLKTILTQMWEKPGVREPVRRARWLEKPDDDSWVAGEWADKSTRKKLYVASGSLPTNKKTAGE